jgi:hypothetical protein
MSENNPRNQEHYNRMKYIENMTRQIKEYEEGRKTEQNRRQNEENKLFLRDLQQWMQKPVPVNSDALEDFNNKIKDTESAFSKGMFRHYIIPIDEILEIDLLSFLNSYKDYSINLLYHIHIVYENFKQNRQLDIYRENMFIESMNNYYLMVEKEKKTLKNSAELIHQALVALKSLIDLIGIQYQSHSSSPLSRSGSPVEGGFLIKSQIKEHKIKKIKAYIKKIMELVESM